MRWIIGDIHGMLGPLTALLGAVRRIDASPRWYFVGDYINRGPDSKGVIDLLLQLSDAQFVRGNHDDIFDTVLHGRSYAPHAVDGDPVRAFKWFMQHGLADTLMSYGVAYDLLEDLETRASPLLLERMLRVVPDSHRRFIRNLRPVIEEEDFFVGHGRWGIDDRSIAIKEQLEVSREQRHVLLWGRFDPDMITHGKSWDRTGYFGHTPVDLYPALTGGDDTAPLFGPKIVLLDTAAALRMTGRLTAFCHDTRRYLQVNRFDVPLPLMAAPTV